METQTWLIPDTTKSPTQGRGRSPHTVPLVSPEHCPMWLSIHETLLKWKPGIQLSNWALTMCAWSPGFYSWYHKNKQPSPGKAIIQQRTLHGCLQVNRNKNPIKQELRNSISTEQGEKNVELQKHCKPNTINILLINYSRNMTKNWKRQSIVRLFQCRKKNGKVLHRLKINVLDMKGKSDETNNNLFPEIENP